MVQSIATSLHDGKTTLFGSRGERGAQACPCDLRGTWRSSAPPFHLCTGLIGNTNGNLSISLLYLRTTHRTAAESSFPHVPLGGASNVRFAAVRNSLLSQRKRRHTPTRLHGKPRDFGLRKCCKMMCSITRGNLL